MMTFDQFKTRLEIQKTKLGTYYYAPANHLICLQGELFTTVMDARHDNNLVDIAKIAQFVRKTDCKDWKLFKLVEV